MELFHKVYSCYYQVVGQILTEALKRPLSERQMEAIVREYGFQESALAILPKLTGAEWALLHKGEDGTYRPAISHALKYPLTRLQKSWLKALLLDPRIHLFLREEEKRRAEELLADIEPLFSPEDFYYFDRFQDGDPYHSAAYQENFRTILQALEEKRALVIAYAGKKYLKSWKDSEPDRLTAEENGGAKEMERGPEYGPVWGERDTIVLEAAPYQLQYSSKDDKFRICCLQYFHGAFSRETVLNLARIKACHLSRREAIENPQAYRFRNNLKTQEPVVIEINGERNSLERCMLHFANYEKHTELVEEKEVYICSIYYDKADETELLIDILSFGPVIRVLGPKSFLGRLKERVSRQHRLLYQEI